MQIKLLDVVNGTPKDSIVEVDEITAKELIDGKKAIMFTEVEAKAEKEILVKSINVIIKKEEKKMREYGTEYVLAKGFRELAKQAKDEGKVEKIFTTKSVVGMSEGGANTGADLVYQALDSMQGMWAGNITSVYSKCRKMTLPAGASSVSVPVDYFTEYAMSSAPTVNITAEGASKTVGAAPTLAVTVQPKVVSSIVAVTDEMLEDIPYFESYLKEKLVQKLSNKIEQGILLGNYGASGGFYGITDGGSSAWYTTVSTSSTPTVTELLNYEKAIDPGLRAGSEWVVGNTFWSAIKASMLSTSNLDRQLIDPVANKLLGYPVNVTCNMNNIVFGNFREYTVVESRKGTVIDMSIHVYFTTDQTLFRITNKIGGTPNYAKRTAVDGSTVAAFAIKAG